MHNHHMICWLCHLVMFTSRMPSSISVSENMENPEQSRARKLSKSSLFGFSTKNLCLAGQYQVKQVVWKYIWKQKYWKMMTKWIMTTSPVTFCLEPGSSQKLQHIFPLGLHAVHQCDHSAGKMSSGPSIKFKIFLSLWHHIILSAFQPFSFSGYQLLNFCILELAILLGKEKGWKTWFGRVTTPCQRNFW